MTMSSKPKSILENMLNHLGFDASVEETVLDNGSLLNVKTQDDLYFSLVSEWTNPEEVVLNSQEPATLTRKKSTWPTLESFQERMMFLDSMTYLPDDILVKVDRAAMGVSLETRAPYLSKDVIEYSNLLPLESKLNNNVSKIPLRNILKKYLPQY